ncbi:hypothetical protein ACET3Z_031411 [Daucus carota]
MIDFLPLPPPGLVAAAAPGNASDVLDEMPVVASPPLNIVPLASSDDNVMILAHNGVDDVQDHSSFDLVAQLPAAVLLGEFDEAASSSDSVAQVTQGVRDVSPVNARGAPVLDDARVTREVAPVGARAVSAPMSARGVREAEPVVHLQACSQANKHQRTMIDVASVGTSNKFAVLEDGEIDALTSTEILDSNSEPMTANATDVPQDAPVVPVDSALPCPVVDAPVSAPVAPVVCSGATVLENALVAPLECPIDATIAPIQMEVDLIEVVCAQPASSTPPPCPQTIVSESAKNKRKKGKGKGKGQNGPFFTYSPQVSPPLASPSKRGKNVDEDGFTHIENKRSLRSRG